MNIRRLVAVDMAWLGAPFILAEYALGVMLPFILGTLSMRAGLFGRTPAAWQTIMGFWLVTIAMNYVSLFIYAVLIARGRSVKEEGMAELKNAKRYGTQQLIILVPFAVVIAALLQEQSRRSRTE